MKNKTLLLIFSSLLITGCCDNSNNPINNEEQGKKEDSGNESGNNDEPIKIKHYLPLRVTEFNGYENKITSDSTYSYSDDLHTVTLTEITDIGYITKEVNTVTFNEDYSKFTCLTEEYKKVGEEFVIDSKDKFDYEVKPNNSYIKVEYDWDDETDTFLFNSEITHTYNERGQYLLSAKKIQNPNDEKSLIYHEYEVFEYDEKGYQTKYESYDYKDDTYQELIKDFYTTFEYNSDKSSLTTENYMYDEEENKYVRDGYETNTISVSNGVITFDNQIYNEDGSKHNHNILKYDQNWVNIYANYGGMNEIDEITYNNYYQITKNVITSNENNTTATATYMPNGGGMLTAHIDSHSVFSEGKVINDQTIDAVFTYNESEQLTKVVSNIDGTYEEGESKEDVKYQCEANITYTTLECDKLLEFLPYAARVVNAFSYYEFATSDTYF